VLAVRRPTDFAGALRVLSAHDVRFVLVGGVAAVLEGAPVTTFDLDIVHDRRRQNLERLEGALSALDAHYRERPDIAPRREDLAGAGHHLLMTNCGPVDVLGAIGAGREYDSLLPLTVIIEIAGTCVRVLRLEGIIAAKEEVAGEKDRLVLPILRATLERKRMV
jgi:hypothetical protein